MAAERLKDQTISADNDFVIGKNRNLRPWWPRPIANRRDGQGNRGDANPALAFFYGWPQCGQTALPSMRFFLQLGHTTSFTFGRVTKWTINPTTGTSQPRIVTS